MKNAKSINVKKSQRVTAIVTLFSILFFFNALPITKVYAYEAGTRAEEIISEEVISTEDETQNTDTEVENFDTEIDESTDEDVNVFEENNNNFLEDGVIAVELLEETPDQPGEIAVKLADIEIEGKEKGDDLSIKEALIALFAVSTTEEDIEKVILETVLEQSNKAIASAILKDSVTSDLLKEAESEFFSTVKGKVKRVIESNDVQKDLVIALEDKPEVEAALEVIITEEFKETVMETLVQEALDGTLTDETLKTAVEEMMEDSSEVLLTEVIAAELIEENEAQNILVAAVAEDTPKDIEEVTAAPLVVTARSASGVSFIIPLEDIRFESGSVVLIIEPTRTFTPGLYTLEIEINNPITGETETLTQDFSWGVLSINTDKDSYKINETSEIHFGILDDSGKPVCDAVLQLEVDAPDGSHHVLSTGNGLIESTGNCKTLEVGNITPDYKTTYTFEEGAGEYTLTLTANSSSGEKTTTSKVNVFSEENKPDFTIKRTSATRNYPYGPTPMTVEVEFLQDYIGDVTDIVPNSFELSNISNNGTTGTSASGNSKTITWTGNWTAGETVTFSYNYDAPDISPEFYTVGPLQIGQYSEQRVWQIANDAAVILFYKGPNAYDISDIVYKASFSVVDQPTLAEGMVFNNDGTKVYMSAMFGYLYEYNLSTPYDISTASYDSSKNVTSKDTKPTGMAFNNDGTKFYFTGNENNKIYEWNLSPAYDISTASYVDDFILVSQENKPKGMAFNNDGSKVYVIGDDGNDINEYNLSPNYDISTAVYDSNFGVKDAVPEGMAFNHDGSKLYTIGSNGDKIYEYDLSPAYDISTGSYVDSKSISGKEDAPRDMAFNDDGTKVYVIGTNKDNINEYTIDPGVYSEAAANDGSINNSNPLVIILTGDTFQDTDGNDLLEIGDIGAVGTEVTINNVSAGLTPVITLSDGDTVATLTFTGNADNHVPADDVDALTFVFSGKAFTSGDASVVGRSGDSEAHSYNMGFSFDPPRPPTLTAFVAVIDTMLENTEVEITLDELLDQGDEADVDIGDMVVGFMIKAVSSGTLKIGADAGSATYWEADTNNTVDVDNNAYWTPDLDINGPAINAFTVVALDMIALESAPPVQAQIKVMDDVPALTSFAAVIDTTTEDTEVEVTLDEFKAQGDEEDFDGTVDGFMIKGVTTGTLKIGADVGSAADWAIGTNDTVDATNNAYWTPALNKSGVIDAFTAVALDNDGLESNTPIQAQIEVTAVNDAPVLDNIETAYLDYINGNVTAITDTITVDDDADSPDSSVLGYWSMNTGSGTTATDLTGNGIDMTLNNGVTWEDGISGTALKFDGSNDYARTGAITGDIKTLAFWFKTDREINKGISNENLMGLEFGNNSSYIWQGSSTSSCSDETLTIAHGGGSICIKDIISAGWHHLAFVWNGVTYDVYVDNTLRTPSYINNGTKLLTNIAGLEFGKRNTNYNNESIDEVFVYDRALDASEIGTLYADGSSPVYDYVESATVQITKNYKDTEDLLAFTDANGITGAWDAVTGAMTLTGESSSANYKAALRSITYENTNTVDPSDGQRIAIFTVSDGNAVSDAVIRKIGENIAHITYSDEGFTEAAANDGSIATTINITLTEDIFTTVGTLTGTHFTANNVPTDLTAEITTTSETEGTLTLTGNATNHTNAYDISNLEIVWLGAAFTSVAPIDITNSTKSNFVVDFIEKMITYTGEGFTESVANDGSVTGSIIATITVDTFKDENNDGFLDASKLTTNAPAELVPVITLSAGDTVATLTFTGNATSHLDADDVADITFEFTDAAFVTGPASTIAGATGPASSGLGMDFDNPIMSVDLTSTSGNNIEEDDLTATPNDVDPANSKVIYDWKKDGTSIINLNMPFEGGSDDTTTKDYSGNGTAVVTGATWNATSGHDGKGAYEFDGTDDYITVDGTSIEYQTFEFWMNAAVDMTDDVGINEMPISFGTADGRYLVFGACGSAIIDETLCFKSGTKHTSIRDDILMGWHHFAFVWNGTNYDVYMDGQKRVAYHQDGTGAQLFSETRTRLGARATGAWLFTGSIDDYRVWGVSLSPEQITALYNDQTNLIASEETVLGDEWQACATPNDGAVDGTEVCSNTITITALNGALAYTGTGFTESVANDGSVTGSIIVTLTGDTFEDTDADDVFDASKLTTNAPANLTPVITLSAGDTVATLTFTEKATSHLNAEDIADITFEFTDAAFVTGPASSIAGATGPASSGLGMDFKDNAFVELSADSADDEAVGGNLPVILVKGTVAVATTVDITDAGSGTATSGIDYDFTSSQTVIIPVGTYDGTTSTGIVIPTLAITDDAIVELNETIKIAIGNPIGDAILGDANDDANTDTEHTYTINNDDLGGVTITIIDDLTDETGNTGTFQIELTSEPTDDVTIALSSDDIDEGTVDASITITVANWNNPAANVVTVTGVDDSLADGSEKYNIITGNVTSTDAAYDALDGTTIDDVAMQNQNDDPPAILLNVTDATSGEDGATATIQFYLAAPTSGGEDVTIPVSLDDSTEGTLNGVTEIVITNANWDQPANNVVTITGVDDTVMDGDIVYTLITGDPTSNNAEYDALIADDVADPSITNIDDDKLLVEFTDSVANDAEASGGNVPTLTVSGAVSTVSYMIDVVDLGTGTATGGVDYGFSTPRTITIPAGDYTTPQTIAIGGLTIYDESTIEGDETIVFQVQNPNDDHLMVGDADGADGSESTHTYTIDNDDGKIIYDITTFNEDTANDGSIGNNPTTATLTGDTFVNPIILDTHVQVNNIPTGLIASVNRTSATTVEISLTEDATAHTNINDIASLEIIWVDAAFTNLATTNIKRSTKINFVVDFDDQAVIAYDATTFTEASANDGSIATTINITLTGDTFATVGALDGTHFTANNVPTGLTATITTISTTTATLTLTGTATDHANANDIANLKIVWNDAAFTNFGATDVTNGIKSDFEVDFRGGGNSGNGNSGGGGGNSGGGGGGGGHFPLPSTGSGTTDVDIEVDQTTNTNQRFSNGDLVKEPGKSTVHLIENGKKRPIFHARVFNDHGFSWDDIIETEDLSDYPTGEMIGSAPDQEQAVSTPDQDTNTNQRFTSGDLIKGRGKTTVYLVENGKKRPIFHARVFNAHGFSWHDVIETEDLSDYPTGEMLGSVPPEAETAPFCSKYIIKYLKFNSNNNNSETVNKLKEFLNKHEGESLDVNNTTYDKETFETVIRFQEKYAKDVLSPWNMIKGSGYVYQTTIKKINEIVCGQSMQEEQVVIVPEQDVSNPTPNDVSAIFTRGLEIDMKNYDVIRLQQLLTTLPDVYPEGIISGYFGPSTEKAVQRFQLKYGVVDSSDDIAFGYVGPATRVKLREVFGGE